jgi:hypothetical protein
MAWHPPISNIRYRSQAVTTPQATPQACVPFWFRETDNLVPVIIKPLELDGSTLTFDVFDTDAEDMMLVEKSLYLLDDEGTNVFLDLPSTVMEWVRNPSVGDYCLALMTQSFVINTLDLPSSVIVTPDKEDEGKWPRTAGESFRLAKIIRGLLKSKAVPDPNDVEFLKGLLKSFKAR